MCWHSLLRRNLRYKDLKQRQESESTGRAAGHASAERAVEETQSVASSVVLSIMGNKVCASGKPSNEFGVLPINHVHQRVIII